MFDIDFQQIRHFERIKFEFWMNSILVFAVQTFSNVAVLHNYTSIENEKQIN